MTIRVAVLGAKGRMGSQTCRAGDASDDRELVAAVDLGNDLASLIESSRVVVVAFTRPDAVMDDLRWCIAHGIDTVVGTTGVDEEKLSTLRDLLADAPDVGVLIAPNFSIGAVLMMQFAQQAARFYESAEIIELHHPDKADAPSGTARRTAELIGNARSEA